MLKGAKAALNEGGGRVIPISFIYSLNESVSVG